MATNAEDIRAGNDIVDVIAQYVALKKAGTQMVGLCPFHKEKTPSFSVHPTKQVYHCHGCGAGGDVFRFVMEIEHVGFVEAKSVLATRCGITFKPVTPAERKAWAHQADERELIEHFRYVEYISAERAEVELHARCAADPRYLNWLKDDLRYVHALTGLVVGMIAVAQERDGDFPKETAA
jgi:DNA primase catalytic core